MTGKYDLGWENPGTINRTDWVQMKDRLARTRPGLRTAEFPSNVMSHISMRTDRPPFNDVRVRQAISLAMDRQGQDTLRDYAARSAAILGLSVPGFWLATLVIVLPALWWGWRPVTGFTEFGADPLAHLGQLLLPGLILGLAAAAALMRLTRAMLLDPRLRGA